MINEDSIWFFVFLTSYSEGGSCFIFSISKKRAFSTSLISFPGKAVASTKNK
jgi:hypothetical protein